MFYISELQDAYDKLQGLLNRDFRKDVIFIFKEESGLLITKEKQRRVFKKQVLLIVRIRIYPSLIKELSSLGNMLILPRG